VLLRTKLEDDDTRLVNVKATLSTFLIVTFVFALVVFIISALKATGLGVNDIAEPSPDTFIDSKVFPWPSFGKVVFTVPVVTPVTVGSNATLKEHVPPAATVVDAVTLQIGALSPVVLSLKPADATGFVIVSELVLLLVNVTFVAAELTLSVCDPKVMELGVNVSYAELQPETQPEPVIGTNCALVGSLSWIASVALCVPVEPGLKVMPIAHSDFVPVQVLLAIM
jgi:hypothetical protein